MVENAQTTHTPLGELTLPLGLGTKSVSYGARDALLYALSIGARPTELDLVYEREAQHALPTFAATLGLSFTQTAAETIGYDTDAVLHIGQRLELRSALPLSGEFELYGEVTKILDKGRAAIISISVSCEAFTAEYAMYVPGIGGFGGERGSRDAMPRPGDEAPSVSLPVSDSAAAVYRLVAQDFHPVHIDTRVAQSAGHNAPILHGLCSLGMSVVAACRAAQWRHDAIRTLSATWSSPVSLGTPIELSWQAEPAELVFESSQSGSVVCQGVISL